MMRSTEAPRRAERPELVGWEITRRCNLTCAHCYTAAAGATRAAPELSTAECRDVIEQAVALGAKLIGWTGGEPLLREDLEELTAFARERGGIAAGVTTNGVLLDERRARSLRDAGIGFVQVSIDGSTAERNRQMRGASDEEFARAVEAVRVCRRLGIDVYLAMVLGAETLDDAPAMLALATELDVAAVRFCGFVATGRGRRSEVIERLSFRRPASPGSSGEAGEAPRDPMAELRAFVATAVERDEPAAMFDPAFGPLSPDYSFHPCVAGMEMLYIAATGDVYPCTSLLAPRFIVGNLHERSLAEIWDDPKMTEMARFDTGAITGPCRSCDHFGDCHGGCRGVTWAHTRDINASFPFCLAPRRE